MELHDLGKDVLRYLYTFMRDEELGYIRQAYCKKTFNNEDQHLQPRYEKIRHNALVVLARRQIKRLPSDFYRELLDHWKKARIVQNDAWILKAAKAAYLYLGSECNARKRFVKVLNNEAVTGHIPRIIIKNFASREASSDKLIQAVLRNDKDSLLKELERSEVWLEAADENSCTALMNATRLGHTELVEILLEKGASVNATDKDGKSALMISASCGRTEEVKILIANGADIEATDNKGNTALTFAANQNQPKIVELLLSYNANINATDYKGLSVLHNAVLGKAPDVVEILVKNGVNVCYKPRQTLFTALSHAIFIDYARIVKIVLKYAADVNAMVVPMAGGDLLRTAASAGRTNMVEILLQNGADANSADEDGLTPLHLAAQRGDMKAVKLLIGSGANVNATHNSGETALDWAEYYGNGQVAKFLREQMDPSEQ